MFLLRRVDMRDALRNALCFAQNLDEVFYGVTRVFRVLDPDGPSKKFFYVSGVITSQGDASINLAKMERRTEEIRVLCSRKVFAPTCVFSDPLARRMRDMCYRHEDWMVFWTRVICSGYVGGVILTPGWERSRGADIEYAIARNLGLAVYFYNDTDLSLFQESGIL